MVQTQYQNMGKGCEGILPQGKGLQNLRKLRKEVVIYKNRQINSFQKVSEGSTGKKIEEKISILKFSTEFNIFIKFPENENVLHSSTVCPVQCSFDAKALAKVFKGKIF